jgi:hypothetical protein
MHPGLGDAGALRVGRDLNDRDAKPSLDGGGIGREFALDDPLGQFGPVPFETADRVGAFVASLNAWLRPNVYIGNVRGILV